MFRRSFQSLLLMAALIATLPGATAPVAAAAQETSDILHMIDGLETAYARRYDSPALHPHLATPEPGTAMDAGIPDLVSTTVLEFVDTDAATAALRLLRNDMAIQMLSGQDDVSIDDFEPVDLGDQGLLYIREPGDAGDTASGSLIVLDGNLGLVVMAHGAVDTIEPALLAFGEFMVRAEPGPAEITFGELADSTGGTFDVMPGRDDADVLRGLVPMYEYDLLLSDSPLEATPAS